VRAREGHHEHDEQPRFSRKRVRIFMRTSASPVLQSSKGKTPQHGIAGPGGVTRTEDSRFPIARGTSARNGATRCRVRVCGDAADSPAMVETVRVATRNCSMFLNRTQSKAACLIIRPVTPACPWPRVIVNGRDLTPTICGSEKHKSVPKDSSVGPRVAKRTAFSAGNEKGGSFELHGVCCRVQMGLEWVVTALLTIARYEVRRAGHLNAA